MKVVFIGRSTLYTSPGGDTVQMLATAKYLTRLNVDVDIKLTHENIAYEHYDLMHFFNIIRPSDILPHLKKTTLPFVISSILVDYSEYEINARKGLYGALAKLMDPDILEYWKVIARSIFNFQKFPSVEYLLKGQKKSIKYILQKTACVLPNSESEYSRLTGKYGKAVHYKIIPNAIDPEIFHTEEQMQRDDKKIICVGRVEGRKNQLNLIRALNDTEYKIFIIGQPSPNHLTYYNICRKEASLNISFINEMKQEDLVHHYLTAKVHVLPSWFETTGLSSLEAAYLGCNIVITDKGDTMEYFGNDAFYCDPDDPSSILNAVQKAAETDTGGSLKKKIEKQYTWQAAAEKTLEAYRTVIRK
jgi:glycosyltransferase involved in cell wall biosynthesis